jgi:transcriptional regulator with XRE-family HTH domain
MSKARQPKGLLPEEAERVRQALRELLADCGGVQRELARRLGVSQQGLSQILNSNRPPGMPLARAIATHRGQSLDEVLTGAPLGEDRPLRDLPGWAEAERIARERNPWIPAKAWDFLGACRTPFPPRTITPEWVAQLAASWASVIG